MRKMIVKTVIYSGFALMVMTILFGDLNDAWSPYYQRGIYIAAAGALLALILRVRNLD
jgi:hypothetical protein